MLAHHKRLGDLIMVISLQMNMSRNVLRAFLLYLSGRATLKQLAIVVPYILLTAPL